MIILFLTFIYCTFLAIYIYMGTSLPKPKKDKAYIRCTFIILVLVHGLVDPDSLPDIEVYEAVFDRLANKPISAVLTDIYESDYGENFEVGYKMVLSIVSKLWHNISFFLFLNSIAFCFLYYYFFKKYSPLFGVSVILFLLVPFNQSLFVLRQHLSVALILLSYPYILERKLLKFTCIIFLSSLLHLSSFIFFPVYFIYGINGKKRLLAIYAISIIMCIGIRVILPLFAALMANSERYSGYAENAEIGVGSRGIIMLLVLIVYFWVLKRKVFYSGINRLVLVISAWGTLIALTLGNAGAGRLFLCFNIILLIQIPITISYIRNRAIRYLYAFSTVLALAFFAYVLSVDAGILEEMEYIL